MFCWNNMTWEKKEGKRGYYNAFNTWKRKVYIQGKKFNLPQENSTIFSLGSPAQVNSWSLKSDI